MVEDECVVEDRTTGRLLATPRPGHQLPRWKQSQCSPHSTLRLSFHTTSLAWSIPARARALRRARRRSTGGVLYPSHSPQSRVNPFAQIPVPRFGPARRLPPRLAPRSVRNRYAARGGVGLATRPRRHGVPTSGVFQSRRDGTLPDLPQVHKRMCAPVDAGALRCAMFRLSDTTDTTDATDTTSDTTAPDTLYAPRPSWTFQSTPSTTSSLGVDGAVQVFKLVDRVRQRGMPRRERRPARRPACRVGLASWLQSMQGEALRIRPRRGRAAARARVLPTLLRRCTSLRASQPG